MALETLNNRYGIRHFEDGGSTGDPTGTVTVSGAPDFDAGYYLAANPDVAANWQGDAFSHYTQYGQNEGRSPTAPTNTQQSAPSGALNIASADFDPKAYLGAAYNPPPPVTSADIAGLYTNVLQRPLDQPGLDFWLGQAQKGASLDAIKQAFLGSQEYMAMPTTTNPAPVQGGLTTPGSTQGVTDWFKTNLVRDPTQAEISSYSQAFGNTIDPTELALLNQLPEFQNRKAIDTSYNTNLGRTGSAEEYNTWMQALASGRSLADVQKDISNAPEAQLYSAYMAETGRKPDPEGYKYFSQRLAQGATLDQIRQEMSGSEEGQKYDVNNLYKQALFRDANPNELTEITNLLKQGYTMDQLRERAYAMPEVMVTQDYMKYTGRMPDAVGLKFWQDQLASGKTKEQIAQGIALSDESIKANLESVKTNLEATLGKNIVASLTPEQLAAYTRTILDPMRVGPKMPASQAEFDSKFYLQNNPDVAAAGIDPYQHYREYGINEGRAGNANAPAYLTQAENLLEVYKQIAMDPVLGAKLKAENPLFWEKVTPLTHRPNEIVRTDRIHYGDFGTVVIDGVTLPLLNGIRADQLFGGEESGTITDFSHHRGNLTRDLGWASNSFSNTFSKGANAVGVTKSLNEDGSVAGYTGLNEAAKVLGIDASKFKDEQVPIISKEQRDEFGNVIQEAGQPVYQKDYEGNTVFENGKPVPAMQTITAQDKLYNAVSSAAKDIYSYTGDSLTTGRAREGGAQSFDTVMYKRVGNELIPISKPVSHGGVQNMDIYRPKDTGLSAPLMMAVAVGAAVVAPQLAPMLVSSLGIGTTTAAIMSGVIVGAGVGAANATIAGSSIGDAALRNGAIGGVTAGLAEGLTTAFPPTVLADGSKVANSVFTGASELMGGAISPSGVQSVVSQTLARTLATATQGASGDKILNTFGTALVSAGLSVAASEQLVSQMTAAGFDKDNIAKLARTVQLAVNTGTTGALSGKNNDQILQSIITSVVSGAPSIAKATGPAPKIEPTNPFGTENVGMTSGSVDNVLQSQIMDGIANKTDDPIAFMNAAKNWTGDGSKNVEYVTTEMVRQGMPANEIAADLQQLYRISADKANEYAQYMVSKGGTKTTPITAATTTTTQAPTNVVAQTSVAAPQPELYDTLVEMFKNPEAAGPAIATLAQSAQAQFLPRYDVGSSTLNLTSGATQNNLGGSDPANDPRSSRVQSPRIGGDEYSNVYPSVTGKASQDVNYIRELAEAYKADPTYAPIREELQKLDPRNAVFVNAQNTDTVRTQAPATNVAPPLYAGKQVTVIGYPELSALPKPVEAPTPMAPEPRPEPMPAVPSPNKPANDPFIIPEPRVPGRPITPIMPVSPPGAIPKIAPGSLPLTSPSIVPTPGIQPISPTPPATPTTPTTTPLSPTAPTQQPSGEPKSAPTPEQQTAIQQVAKTQQDAQRLEIAVPRATQLINQGMPRPVVIPKVAAETGVTVQDLATVINATVPEVTVPTPSVTAPTVTTPTPAPKTPAPKTPTTATRNAGVISPFLIQQYGGIQDLSPGLTGGGDYSLSGIPSTDTNMNPMTPNFPLQQFASTSPPSPLELGAQQQPNEPIQLATGGSTSQQAYNPYDVSSGISGSLTPGLTKARLDYILTGLPQSKAEGGSIEGHNPQFFSEGGLGSMENTFVEGDGDGTSDQVPAMLANGEFVIPADVVSGLGNGSNDAGAEVLQEFLKAIREHKHSAKADKLPPESKGPLAYLTNAKRKVKVA